MNKLMILFFAFFLGNKVFSQEVNTEINDLNGSMEKSHQSVEDVDIFEMFENNEEFVPSSVVDKETSSDDLVDLQQDVDKKAIPEKEKTNITVKTSGFSDHFDVGAEERELLKLAESVQGQISDDEWGELAKTVKVETYTVVKGDWLFKISKKLFGTGHYYPKIWSLNEYITNPHFIEPGMILSFTTGTESSAPEVKIGSFSKKEIEAKPGENIAFNGDDFSQFGDEAQPDWMIERQKLKDSGVFLQNTSIFSIDDLKKIGAKALNREYEHYDPPKDHFDVIVPNTYDETGFDKNSKIFYSVKEGFYLSTFVSTNIIQDLGKISNGADENMFFVQEDHAYVQFDDSINAVPGDRFSVYKSHGKVAHKNSDRKGYEYSIIAQIEVLRKIEDKWEVKFLEVSGTPQRGDRITIYTPKIERISKTYNSRIIEAAILGSYASQNTLFSLGDVLYLDRGRADGVELGNVFLVYDFKDRLTKKNITNQPTYRTGELTVITLTDNFSTVLVTKSYKDFYIGDLAITQSKEGYLNDKSKSSFNQKNRDKSEKKDLEELDVELNLSGKEENLLDQIDNIQLTEDELAELERQEKEKSIMKDSEKDLRALERLESEIEKAESILQEVQKDEDGLLEKENLNEIEKKQKNKEIPSLEEVEDNVGKLYLDEDLNSKDNPFGLTEFDIEEVDELLNIEKKN